MPRFDPRQLNRAGMFSQGLLNRAGPTGNLLGGRGLFGPNIRQGGVSLGTGRNTLIGPNPAATNAMGNAINRFAPRGLPTPTSPRVMNTGGAKVSDIFKNAQMGQFGATPAAQSPLAGYGQFGPPAQQVQGVQGVQGTGPTAMQGIDALGTAAGTKVGGMMDINPGLRQLSEDTKAGLGADQGPQGFMSKIGGFLNKPGIGQSMMAAGAQMMRGSPDGTFATIGEGLEVGLGKYQALKKDRRIEEDREEEKRIRDEDRARRIIAEDLATSQAAGRREAYGKIMPIDPETGERGEFNMEAWDDAWATALEQGDTDFAIVLTQMRPEDPDEIPLDKWKEANGAREDENGDWRKVWYRTGADGNIETQLSEYTVAPPAGARAGGAGGVGGQFQKEESLGLVSLAAINSLVDTGGWMSLAGWVRDDDAFDELQGQILLDNPDATAVQIMEATRSAWSKAEGYLPEGSWFNDDGELQLGDEASMMINMVLSDPSGSSEEGDWAITKFLKAKGKEWAQNNAAGAAYATATAHALQAINPLVRYLSGAQMTNREAMRYYGAVIPSWGDSQQTVNAKMRGLSLLARAMGGDIEAMERVDMRGFVDDPNLGPQGNIKARGEWAQAQLTRIVMEEQSSTSRGANVEAARTRQEEDLALFHPDGTPIDPAAAQNAPITGAAAMDYALRGRSTPNQPMFPPRTVGPR